MKYFFRKFFENFRVYLILAVLLLISLSLIPLNDHSSLKNIKTISFASFAVINYMFSSVLGIMDDDSEIIEQKKINAELMLELNLLRNYALENKKLKNLVTLKDSSKYPLIAASVISKLVSHGQGNLVINRGKIDSVKNGMPVINEKGLIGVIINTSNSFSVIRTLKNSKLNIAVTDQRSNIDGIMNWNGEHLVIRNIPSTYDIQRGDRIVTSDFSTLVPPSIPVGVVSEKKISISGLLSDIVVLPYVDLPGVSNVFVIGIVESEEVEKLKSDLYELNK